MINKKLFYENKVSNIYKKKTLYIKIFFNKKKINIFILILVLYLKFFLLFFIIICVIRIYFINDKRVLI